MKKGCAEGCAKGCPEKDRYYSVYTPKIRGKTAKIGGQKGVKKGSKRGQKGVKKGSKRGQKRVKKDPILTPF